MERYNEEMMNLKMAGTGGDIDGTTITKSYSGGNYWQTINKGEEQENAKLLEKKLKEALENQRRPTVTGGHEEQYNPKAYYEMNKKPDIDDGYSRNDLMARALKDPNRVIDNEGFKYLFSQFRPNMPSDKATQYFLDTNYVNKSEFAAWCKEQGYGAFDTQSNTTDQGQKEVKLPDQSVDSSAYKVLSKLFGMPPGTEGQLSQVTSTSNTFKYQSCFFKQDNVYEGSVSNVEGNLKIDIEQHPNKGFLFGVGVGAKNTADNIADFMMKFHPRDIPLILQSAGEKGLLYDLTLGNWTKKGKELLQATNSQEAGTKAFELGADIGSTIAGAGLVRKAGTSLIDASKTVVKGLGKVEYGELDSLGRPTGMTAIITEDMIGTGTKASQSIKPPGFEGGGPGSPGHARGHLLGKQLGGFGDDPRNLVTLFQNPVNSPVMRDFESSVRVAVESGEVVEYKIIPVYEGDNLIPSGVIMSARGTGGFKLDVTVLNRK